MDTPAAYRALEESRKCASGMPVDEMRRRGRKAFDELDEIVKTKAKAAACKWVADLNRSLAAKYEEPEQRAGTDLVVAQGICERFSIGSLELTCKQVAYLNATKTGRTSFNIPHENGALGLSGGRDMQPSAEAYVLSVDSVLNGRGTDRLIVQRQRAPAPQESAPTVYTFTVWNATHNPSSGNSLFASRETANR